MTQKDSKLIEAANKVHYIDWCKVSDMEKEAESDEAKRILHNIASSLYHQEEWSAGLL